MIMRNFFFQRKKTIVKQKKLCYCYGVERRERYESHQRFTG